MKTYTFTVTIPNVPDDWDWTRVQLWLYNQITHPYDAAYEGDVTVEPTPTRIGVEK